MNLDNVKQRMDGAVDALHREFGGLRTGRASNTMLDPIHVEAYGSAMPLNQVATVNVPEPRMLTVTVWEIKAWSRRWRRRFMNRILA